MLPFAETPQGKSLMRRVESASSNWLHVETLKVYRQARDYYESQQRERLATGHAESIPAVIIKEKSMSLEQALEANTAALTAMTAAFAKVNLAGSAASTTVEAAAPAAAKAAKATKAAAPAPAAPKNEHTREELVAVLGEVKEKFSIEDARELFVGDGIEKMKDIPDSKIDTIYAAAKAKLQDADGADL